LRFAADYMYLLTDSTKQAEARTLALTLCTLLTIPGITEVVTQGVLLAWAYGEAVQDVKALLSGEKIGIWKSSATWKLSLENLMNFEESGNIQGMGDGGGLGYKEYLQILLYLKGKVTLCMRALDLIEENIKRIDGHSFFRVDHCVTGLEVQAECQFRKGVEYHFSTMYQYQ